jgi:protein-disulfide isomerase
MGWSIAFAVVAIVIVGAAYFLTQQPSGSSSDTLTHPTNLTPTNIPTNGLTLGQPNAPVTVDIYGDFRCSACKKFTISGPEQSLVVNYVATGKAKLVWHDRLIIDEISGGTNSLEASNAAWCAADQNSFWPMHDWLYANSSEVEMAFSPAMLSAMGQAIGLDMAKFQPCLDGGTHDAAISAENASEAKSIDSTPTIYVNGKSVGNPGYVATYDQIKAAIDAVPSVTPSPSPAASAPPSPSPSASA